MTTYSGHLGSASVAGEEVGEMKAFDLTHEAREHDNSAMGKGYTSVNPGQETLSGSMTLFHDHGDAGQQELVVGAEVACIFYPTGETTGHQSLAATMVVLSKAIKAANDGDVEATYQVKSKSGITTGTVS